MMKIQRLLFFLCSKCKKAKTWKRTSKMRMVGFSILYRVIYKIGL